MSSVDDRLRQAFATPDEEWVRRTAYAHGSVVARHRHDQVVRRGVAAAVCAAAVVAAVAVSSDGSRPRTVQPVAPTPPTSAPASPIPIGTTPLEGRWISGPLDADDVRAAARAAGDAGAAVDVLDQLPPLPFRVVVEVRGATLTTVISSAGADNQVLDRQSLSVSGARVALRPFALDARTVHSWTLSGDRLELDFVSTTEGVQEGVPGEAWQRLLYDSVPFAR